jgi:hypothetical protein
MSRGRGVEGDRQDGSVSTRSARSYMNCVFSDGMKKTDASTRLEWLIANKRPLDWADDRMQTNLFTPCRIMCLVLWHLSLAEAFVSTET